MVVRSLDRHQSERLGMRVGDEPHPVRDANDYYLGSVAGGILWDSLVVVVAVINNFDHPNQEPEFPGCAIPRNDRTSISLFNGSLAAGIRCMYTAVYLVL
jgi:hypothetical protein